MSTDDRKELERSLKEKVLKTLDREQFLQTYTNPLLSRSVIREEEYYRLNLSIATQIIIETAIDETLNHIVDANNMVTLTLPQPLPPASDT